MDTKTEKIYWEALDLTVIVFDEFYTCHKQNIDFYETRDEFQRNAAQIREEKKAAELCGKLELICALFGVGEDQVHEDLFALRKARYGR